MFSSSSSRKQLLRPSSDRPAMRNWPLFIFLFGLVFFFYLFYIYQAQSTELTFLREQLENLQQLNLNTKKQYIDAKAEIEKFKNVEDSMKSDKIDCTNKFEECTSSLRNAKLKVDNDLLEKKKLEQTIQDKEDLVVELRRSVAEGERNTTSLKSLLSAQENLSKQLNDTIQILKNEVATLKSGVPAAKLSTNNEIAPAKQLEKVDIGEENPINVETTTVSSLLNNEEQPDDGAPQLAFPVGPGGRVKVEAEDSLKEEDKANDDDLERKNIPPPDGLLDNGGEQL